MSRTKCGPECANCTPGFPTLYIVHETPNCYYVEAPGWSIRRVWK